MAAQFHPANAQAYARRAKLEALAGDWAAAHACAAAAQQRLAVCNPGSRLLAEMQQVGGRARVEGFTPAGDGPA